MNLLMTDEIKKHLPRNRASDFRVTKSYLTLDYYPRGWKISSFKCVYHDSQIESKSATQTNLHPPWSFTFQIQNRNLKIKSPKIKIRKINKEKTIPITAVKNKNTLPIKHFVELFVIQLFSKIGQHGKIRNLMNIFEDKYHQSLSYYFGLAWDGRFLS